MRLYLLGFRDQTIGAEALAARIRDALAQALEPEALSVELVQNVRGGLVLTAQAHVADGVPRG